VHAAFDPLRSPEGSFNQRRVLRREMVFGTKVGIRMCVGGRYNVIVPRHNCTAFRSANDRIGQNNTRVIDTYNTIRPCVPVSCTRKLYHIRQTRPSFTVHRAKLVCKL